MILFFLPCILSIFFSFFKRLYLVPFFKNHAFADPKPVCSSLFDPILSLIADMILQHYGFIPFLGSMFISRYSPVVFLKQYGRCKLQYIKHGFING